ncbi:MAG: aspartate kinase [Chlamydiota bacterium]|nr:aspartate kinase [Chlamydiota bacterium]
MSDTIVMKFGGAAVASPEKFDNIADIILEKKKVYPKVVVVLSAMGNTTDELITLAKKVHPNPPQREYDMLVSVGERISISLLAMALAKKGENAKSFTGSQSGIVTTDAHANAEIIDVRPHRLLSSLETDHVTIVAGFQGVSVKGEITTLGRGGSDTTAVALAVALGAKTVEFYKDVSGVYDKDPKICDQAKLIPVLSYEEALNIVSQGAKILHSRCLNLAEKNGITLSVCSFQSAECPGTMISGRVSENMRPIYELELVM